MKLKDFDFRIWDNKYKNTYLQTEQYLNIMKMLQKYVF